MAVGKYQIPHHLPSGGFKMRCYPQLARHSASPQNPIATDEYRSKGAWDDYSPLGTYVATSTYDLTSGYLPVDTLKARPYRREHNSARSHILRGNCARYNSR
jgi:hypothetical protein